MSSTASSPLVSVVIPTRNRPALLRAAVESALGQTWPAVEVVVVVDGPDPSTVASLAGISDPRLRVLALDESVGGAEARNAGARQARGTWLALLDDDDHWLPGKLAAQMAAVAGMGSRNVLAASRFLQRNAEGIDVVRPRRLPRPGEPVVEFMFDYLCYFQTSTLLCSIDVIRRHPFQKGLALFQDIDWFLRVNSDPDVRFVAVPEVLSVYNEPAQRKTITGTTGWRARLAWGRERRALLGRRAYTRFIVGSCVCRAAEDRAGLRGLARLLYEAVLVGSATPRQAALLLGAYLLPPSTRKRVRDLLFLRKPAPLPGAASL